MPPFDAAIDNAKSPESQQNQGLPGMQIRANLIFDLTKQRKTGQEVFKMKLPAPFPAENTAQKAKAPAFLQELAS